MRDARELVSFHVEKLSAPDGTIEPVSRTVPRHAEVRSLNVILGGAGGHVRLMKLRANHGQPRLLRPLRRSVIRMQIAAHDLGLKTVEPTQLVDRFLERG